MLVRGVDEVDVALLDALHVNPRASFERLGSALGISAVTAARRWERLAGSGRAWVSSVPGPRLALVGAVYEAEAKPGRTAEVGRALAEIPQVASVYLTDGGFDLHVLVFAGDMTALSALVFDRLPRVAGMARGRARVGLEWFSGVRWRLGAISSGQEQSVCSEEIGSDEASVDSVVHRRTMTFADADRALYLALQRDGRARYRDLARDLGSAEHVVRRRMASLVRKGMLSFRTDFARGEGGWPAELVLWLRVPHDGLARVGMTVGEWPETRICLSAVGAENLLVMAQVHQLAELGGLLDRLGQEFPDVVVADQRVVLRPLKSWGRLLDHTGHSTGMLPVDPWAPTLPDASSSVVELVSE
ncbi:Lrp/AsnC family transcriptional regulator [Actinophytocola sp.]|uniref:Lrp/AsnC family transcriptional regulator n=1 Tax=Actinophytocola sp. TaxID=1872138 RepID=UPI002ED9BF9B